MFVFGISLTSRGFLVSLPRPSATILVIDHEQISRGVAYRILSDESYRVLEAETCSETLDALHLAQGRVDLLMINVVMPECDGVAVGRDVLEQWPEQRILYMSAHPAEVLARHRMAALEGAFLTEPYTRGEVLAKVKQALEQQPQGKRVLTIHEEHGIETMVEHA